MTDKQLYFIAFVPPEQSIGPLWELKQQVARKFLSKAALRSPPHITFHMPFNWSDKKLDQLSNTLFNFCINKPAINVKLNGFGAFPPKVIYVKVEANPLLTDFQKSLCELLKQRLNLHHGNYKDRPFKPHLTIAFRDLKKPQFIKAWEFYAAKRFQQEYHMDRLTLLRHDGKVWQSHLTFEMQKS